LQQTSDHYKTAPMKSMPLMKLQIPSSILLLLNATIANKSFQDILKLLYQMQVPHGTQAWSQAISLYTTLSHSTKGDGTSVFSPGLCFSIYDTKWDMSGFVHPKKDGSVIMTDDMRESSKRIQQSRYPIPTLKDIFERHRNYVCFIKIDISVQFYAFILDDKSSDMCVIVTPFGKYQ
jgi:hypothetical protein